MTGTSKGEVVPSFGLRNRSFSKQIGRQGSTMRPEAFLLRSLALFAPIGLATLPLCAEQLSIPSPHALCAEADAIITGERVGASSVKVRQWLRARPDLETRSSLIEIPELEKNQRVVVERGTKSKGSRTRHLKSQQLLCFLVKNRDRWQVMNQGEAGSLGMVWIEAGRCYQYEQIENHDGAETPGYSLVVSKFCKTEEELLTQVRRGLKDRRKWERALAIENPEEQAIVLCSYLLRRTSPEGAYETYRKRVRALLPKLGEHAVAELMILLRRAKAGDRLDEAILILKDLGPLARPATGDIVRLLEESGRVDSGIAIEALARIGDTTVAHRILPFLQDTLHVRAVVAGAMASFGYQDSIPLIEKALPNAETVKATDAHHIYAMLQALHELGAEKTPRFTRDYLQVPAMRHLHDLLEPFLDGRDME
ncbi:MAG: hypothetical protein CMN02_12110 [Roseibacillus sp.]|nr:hypothetical protein [Roseibacillus sp.]